MKETAMRYVRRIVNAVLLLVSMEGMMAMGFGQHPNVRLVTAVLSLAVFLGINARPCFHNRMYPSGLWLAESGRELLQLFLLTDAVQTIRFGQLLVPEVRAIMEMAPEMQQMILPGWIGPVVLTLGWLAILEGILFWNGMIRVLRKGKQVSVLNRVVMILTGWLPFVNFVFLAGGLDALQEECRLRRKDWQEALAQERIAEEEARLAEEACLAEEARLAEEAETGSREENDHSGGTPTAAAE